MWVVCIPGYRTLSQSLFNIHVITLKVHNYDIKVLIFGLSVQELHVTDELLYPSSLVLHCPSWNHKIVTYKQSRDTGTIKSQIQETMVTWVNSLHSSKFTISIVLDVNNNSFNLYSAFRAQGCLDAPGA